MAKFLKILILACFFATSCGFEIIYKEEKKSGDDISYAYELAAIDVKNVKIRSDQIFKNNLLDILNPDNIKTEKKYFLDFTIIKTISPTFITATGASGRDKITLEVRYRLTELKSQNITTGSTIVSDDFNIDENRFGNYNLEEATEQNLAKIAAQNIRNLIVSDLIDFNKKNQEID